MLKFFRRIRQKLVEKGNPRKYLVYAAGEVFLVMIGILLALQVNNWNERRKERNTEKMVLAALHSEFSEARDDLEDWKASLEKQRDALNKLITYCGPSRPTISIKSLDTTISKSFTLPTFDPPSATLNDLINSGKIDVISNQQLRGVLSAWNGKLEESKRQEDFQGAFLYNQYAPYIEERIEFPYQPYMARHMSESELFGIDSRDLLQDFRFCNLVKRAFYWNTWVNIEYNKLGREIDRIIELTHN